MFSTIFWAVPAFRRVEPVMTSGPTSANQDLGQCAHRCTWVHRDCHGRRPTTSRVLQRRQHIRVGGRCGNPHHQRRARSVSSLANRVVHFPLNLPRLRPRGHCRAPSAINACTSSGRCERRWTFAASSTAIRRSNLLLHISAAPVPNGLGNGLGCARNAGAAGDGRSHRRSSRFIRRTISTALMRSRLLDGVRCLSQDLWEKGTSEL